MDETKIPTPRDRWILWGAIAVTIVLIVLRKPWALHTPQLWAEDGCVFLLDSDLDGFSSIFHVHFGYVVVLPRLIALAAPAIADPAWWPLIYNIGALMVTAVVLVRMASTRLALPHKAWLVLAFALAANTGEVLLNITNVQWIAAFLLIQQLLMTAPVTARQVASDAVLVALAGLTGPFALLLLPFFAWRAWRDHAPGNRIVCAIAFACAGVQIWALATGFPPRPVGEARPVDLLAIVGNRIFVWPFLGHRVAELLPPPALAAAGILAASVVAWQVLRTDSRRRHEILAMSIGAVLLMTVLWRARPDMWSPHDLLNGDRYFFIPRLMFVWLVIWRFDSRQRWVRVAARLLCVLGAASELSEHVLPAPTDYHWIEYADAIRLGVPVAIPTLPEGHAFMYPGREANRR